MGDLIEVAEQRIQSRSGNPANVLKRTQELRKELQNTKDILKNGIPPTEWQVQNLIVKGGMTLIASPPKQYKTYIAQSLGISIATGEDFLGQFKTNKGNVLYVDEENGKILLNRRFQQFVNGMNIEAPDNILQLVYTGVKLVDVSDVEALQTIIIENDITTVIFDSMVRFMGDGDEDKARDVRKVFDNLKGLMEDQDVSIVILIHTRKDRSYDLNSIRGSGDFSAMADVILMLRKNKGGLKMTMEANRHIDMSEVKPFEIVIESDADAINFVYGGLNMEKNVEEVIIMNIKHWATENKITDTFESKALFAAMYHHKHKKTKIYDAMRTLEAENKMVKVDGQRAVYQFVPGRFLVEEQDV